jgi:hypothetical protein
VESENAFLKEQYEKLKREIKITKNTQEGEMVAEYKKMTKTGGDPIGNALEVIEEQIEVVDELYQFIVSFRDRRITIKDFLKGPKSFTAHGGRQISQEELIEILLR